MAGCDGPIGHEQRVDQPVLFDLALKLLSGTNTARTSPCCGRSEKSPSADAPRTARTVSRSVRPRSSLRPCSDSIGIADGRSMRTITVLSADAPISAASARLMNAPRASGPPFWPVT